MLSMLRWAGSGLGICLLASTQVLAQAPTEPPSAAADGVVVSNPTVANEGDGVALTNLTEITVRDHRSGPLGSSEVLTSTNVLGGDVVQLQTANETLHVLKRVPGIYMEDYNQGVTSTGLSIRGFNTQGDVPAIKLLIDGIPSNYHTGASELKAVFPLEIDHFDVVKGTNDPRYGLNNVAGNVNVRTRQGEDVQIARVLGGSFRTIEPQLLSGFRTGPLQHTYFFGYRSSQGFRDNSRMDRIAASGKLFYEPTQRLKVGLIARGMHLDAQSPGYLTPEEARETPRLSPLYAREDAGMQRVLHLSGHLDYALLDDFSLQAKAYLQSFARDRSVSFDPEMQQQLRREREWQHGAIAVLTYRAPPRALGLSIELGADYQGQDNKSLRYDTIARVPQGDPVRNYDFLFSTAGSYLQASIKPLPVLKVVAALRADVVWGELEDRGTGDRYDMNDFGVIWQPKLSAAWTVFDGQRLYANYGRTFQVNTGIGAYQTTPGTRLDPSINDGFEAGLRSTINPWLAARAAAWRQLASREVRIKPDNSGESENIGKTDRYGLDLELTVTPIDWLSVWGAFSPVVAKQSEPGSGEGAELRRDKTLNHVPWYTAKAGIDYRRHEGLFVSLWCYAQGAYYLTKENDAAPLGDYIVVNLDARYEVNPWLDLGLSIQNLLNNDYDASIWYKDYGQIGTLHSPGAPLSGYVSATLTL
ncbi:MAG: TonB-dependent receptor [Polyangiales bacterium]